MQTPSHFLVTALMAYKAPAQRIPMAKGALLIGSVLPDIPFTLLTLGGEIYYRWFGDLPVGGSIMAYLHFTLFYTDPVWIISHNFFHSLVINAVFIAVGYYGWRKRTRWGAPLFWLAVSMVFHTLIDIFTHNSDGPLFLLPLHWTYRFASPISYWESENYGRIFMTLEYTLDALILIYFAFAWWRRRAHQVEEELMHHD